MLREKRENVLKDKNLIFLIDELMNNTSSIYTSGFTKLGANQLQKIKKKKYSMTKNIPK